MIVNKENYLCISLKRFALARNYFVDDFGSCVKEHHPTKTNHLILNYMNRLQTIDITSSCFFFFCAKMKENEGVFL